MLPPRWLYSLNMRRNYSKWLENSNKEDADLMYTKINTSPQVWNINQCVQYKFGGRIPVIPPPPFSYLVLKLLFQWAKQNQSNYSCGLAPLKARYTHENFLWWCNTYSYFYSVATGSLSLCRTNSNGSSLKITWKVNMTQLNFAWQCTTLVIPTTSLTFETFSLVPTSRAIQ